MRLCTRILLLLAAVLLILPAYAAEDGNLLINGSFDRLDGDGLPSGWYTEAWFYDNEVTHYSVTQGRSGCAAAVENINGNDARFAQNVKVEPSSLYRLSGYILADGIVDSGRGANLSVSGLHAYSDSVFESDGKWAYVEMYGKTGPEQETVTVFARVGGYSALSMGYAAFDDLRLEKVSSVPSGRRTEPWYKTEVEIKAAAQETVKAAGEAGPFWPWLLVLSGAYLLFAYMVWRWLPVNDGELKRREKASWQDWLPLLGVLAGAALVRLLVASRVTGYEVDVNCFISWGMTFREVGPGAFYQTTSFCDYPPAYLYAMGFGDWLNSALGGLITPAFAHKQIPMLCDLLAATLVYRIAWEEEAPNRSALLAAAFVAFNPALIINSAAWCQVDSALCLLLMLVAYLAIRGKWAAVLPVYVLSILVKPQALMLGFLGLAAIIMALVRQLPSRTRTKQGSRISFPLVWRQMGWGLVWSLLVALAVILPTAIGRGGISWLFELYGNTLASYPYATVNTANLYYLFNGNWNSILADANRGVTAVLLFMTAAWCVLTFMRRRDRRLTFLEPAIAVVLVMGLALSALGLMPLLNGSGEGYILSLGNPWRLTHTTDGYVRSFIPDAEGAWAVQLPPVMLLVCGVLLIAASVAMGCLLRMRLKEKPQEGICLGLIEPALLLLFATVFAFMLIFDVTWGALGTVAMALAFVVVLSMFIRGGRMDTLPLCGAVLFILLYVFGVKMHERYLFPALFLLGMAYVYRRDRRLVWLLAGLSCTLFINEGIVLDNSIRLGRNAGHLNQDTYPLACMLSFVNVALALWSVWLCHRICVEQEPVKQTTAAPSPVIPVQEYDEFPCSPLNYEDSHRVRWDWLDAVLIAVVSAVYAIVTFTTLGSMKAPQNAYVMPDEQSSVVIDLGGYHDDFTFLYNCQVSYSDFSVETSDDGVNWPSNRLYWAQMAEGECFRWKYLTPHYMNGSKRTYYGASELAGVVHLSGRYVRITAQRQHRYDAEQYSLQLQAQEPLIFNEVLFRNAAGETINARIVGVYEPDGTALPAYSMRWRVSDARELQLESAAMLLENEDVSLLQLAAAQCLSAAHAPLVGEAAMAQPQLVKTRINPAALGLMTPPWTQDASALLDEQDTLEGEPGWWNSTYFDEIYHARTGFEHATGQDAYEWTHPPLGKVIMSWFIRLFGMTPFGWRFAGALCGVLMLPAMYALAKQLTKKRLMAFAAMLLMAVDCMHFTQTRIATIDSYPVLFIILSYFFMLRFIQRDVVVTPMKKLLPDLAFSGFFMGCGVASKWIGIYAGVGLAVLYFWACLRAIRVGIHAARIKRMDTQLSASQLELLNRRDLPAMGRVIRLCLWCLLFFVAVPLAIYLASYVVHYQAREVDGLFGWLKLVWDTQINILNYHGTPRLGMDHPYYSPWYEWFTMQKPMYYASPSFVPDGWRYAIYCFGNPLVWYVGLAGVVYAACRWVRSHRYSIGSEPGTWQLYANTWDMGPAFVLIGLAAQLLPWVLVPRGTYIYHYFASVPFLILGAVLLLDRLYTRWPMIGLAVTLSYLAVAAGMFVLLFPYASGVTSPVWWMDLIRHYPWINAGSSPLNAWVASLMEAIPMIPNVW